MKPTDSDRHKRWRATFAMLIVAFALVLIGLSSGSQPASAEYYQDMNQRILYENQSIQVSVKIPAQTHDRVMLIMQNDGNLVLYRRLGGYWSPLWASGTVGNPGARAVFQNDGNLVVYNSSWVPLWASNTCCTVGATLVVPGDANMVIWNGSSSALYATNTSQTGSSYPPPGSVNFAPRFADNAYHTHVQDEVNLTERNRWQWRFDGPGAEYNYEPTVLSIVKASALDSTTDVFWSETTGPAWASAQCVDPIPGLQLCNQWEIKFSHTAANQTRSHRKNNIVCHEFAHTIGFRDPVGGTGTMGSSCSTSGGNARSGWWERQQINARNW